MPRQVRPACARTRTLIWSSLPILALSSSARAGFQPATPVSHTAPGAWASGVASLTRGPIDIADPGGELASFGVAENALGPASGEFDHVVSLGDGGQITLSFDAAILDGPGADLAVFENGFEFEGSLFGELAFVEVSSDGASFARFPSESLTPGLIGAFDPVDPANVHNLAGVFPQLSGTPFDLADLATHALVSGGSVDLTNIRFVRLVDVIGDGSTEDSLGRAIYDPYPTAFASGGFDLESVGVLHAAPEPSALALLALALASVIASERRRLSGLDP